jgi:hypothetical protein
VIQAISSCAIFPYFEGVLDQLFVRAGLYLFDASFEAVYACAVPNVANYTSSVL